MWPTGAAVASWSLTQEMAGPSPFTVMTNIFSTLMFQSVTSNRSKYFAGHVKVSYCYTHFILCIICSPHDDCIRTSGMCSQYCPIVTFVLKIRPAYSDDHSIETRH